MERDDVWLAPDEEALFNAEAEKHNTDFLPLIHTDLYLSAFTHIHRQHNPLIPQWVVECSASNFVSVVTEKWDSQAAVHQKPQDMNEKRFMVIGAAHRLCSLPLQMDQGSLHDEGYISTAQKRGLLYHIRANIPSLHTYVIQRYDGIDAANHLEGAEVLSILVQLFATLEVNPPDFNNILLRQYGLLGGEQSDDSVIPFTKEDFRQRAQVNDSKNPLQVAMSAIAGKLCEFEDLGRSVSYLP